MIVEIDDELYIKCEKFAIDRISGSVDCYVSRGESRRSKIVEDLIVGAIGEWVVYEHLKSLGYECSEPDMKIYEKRRKSFAADLYVDEINIHVKSQSLASSKRYGYSWLMQRHDKAVKNPQDDEIFAFTNVNLEDMEATVLGYCWAKNMTYGECKVPRYRNTKVAIYLQDVEGLITEV